jgi:predicted GNAT family acetyltransferase
MEPRLLAAEERHGLMLGIALAVRQNPQNYGSAAPYFATVTARGEITAAALITPPFGIVLYGDAQTSDAALDAIAADLAARRWSLPTAIGPDPLPARFAACWSARRGVAAEIGVAERAFVLRRVNHPRYSPGRLRPATLADRELVQQWFVDFNAEALGNVEIRTDAEIRERAAAGIDQGTIYLWEDGQPVSLAGAARPTRNGINVGPVYTPPELRGRGYASSLVAALSQQLLDGGRKFVTLFTDLSNPTSNHIYQAVGYEPVCDYTMYRFVGS